MASKILLIDDEVNLIDPVAYNLKQKGYDTVTAYDGKTAVEAFYGVTVTDVNTLVVPGKNKSRQTKTGLVQGIKPSYKKAFVTVAVGETIDLYANI